LLAAQTLYYKGMDTTTLSASFIQQDHDGKHLGLIFLIRANMWMFSSLNSKNKTTSEYPNDGHVTVVGGVFSVCGDSSDPHCAVCLVMSQPREYSVEIKEHVANVGRADEIRVVTVFDFHLANRFNGIIPILYSCISSVPLTKTCWSRYSAVTLRDLPFFLRASSRS